MRKYTNALSSLRHLPSRIARSEGCLWVGKNTNALPPLWHLPSRIARSAGCLEWGSTILPYLFVALTKYNCQKWTLPRMGKYTNALPHLRHLPSRIARSDGCLEWGSTQMPFLLCGTYQVELPEVKVASNGAVTVPLWTTIFTWSKKHSVNSLPWDWAETIYVRTQVGVIVCDCVFVFVDVSAELQVLKIILVRTAAG